MNFQAGIIVAEGASSAVTAEIRAILIGVAKAKQTITYSELASRITAARIKANDEELAHALDAVSISEINHGRGMLSVVVVSRRDGLPGYGFFRLARKIGRKVSDRSSFWESEFDEVCAVWSDL